MRRTTRPDAAAKPSADLMPRQFTAAPPNQLWVADCTYVATCCGFVDVAFVIDVFSRRIVGWRAHTTMRTALVLDALERALHDRERDGPLIVHTDRGAQYVAVRSTSRCGTRSGCSRPVPHRPSAASAMQMTMHSPSR